ncbi:MAG: ATP-binding protein, partial [Flavobacteriaceae bacterium]|nr:ATP-binding protein [Flavobacteriaceae bacterium]
SELNIPFIAFNSVYEEDIYKLYNNLKTKSDKENLIRTLQVIDKKITDVELRQNFDDLENVFLLSFENKDEFVPVNYLGDGFKRIFYIALKTLSLKGKRIMIDEIETGIHHSRQKDFWLSIIKICQEMDVQLFATTHSRECLNSFIEIANKIEIADNARVISMQEEDSVVKTYTYFAKNLDTDFEYRG